MDFLREALQRNRRVMEIRDIAILALRTLAILLIGFALARPFVSRDSIFMWTIVFPAVFIGVLATILAVAMWSSRLVRWSCLGIAFAAFITVLIVKANTEPTSEEAKKFDGKQPLHAVILVDNSLSMAYEEFGTSLLDKAKSRANDYLDKLPEGSQVTIVSLCGAPAGEQLQAVSKDDARDILTRIQVVDRGTNVQAAVNAARRAAEQGPELGRRIVLLSDQQSQNWRGLSRPEQFKDFPEMQVVATGPEDPATVENTSIVDFRVAEGVADIETPTRFIVRVHHDGPVTRKKIPVTFSVDDIEIPKAITLEPNQTREIVFEYKFDSQRPQPGKADFVPVKVSIPSDRLPLDDTRHLVVPVVASFPVVFVDQYGQGNESPVENKVGETKPLRKLLAPRTSRSAPARQLIEVRHVTVGELDEALLSDARMVVLAGIDDPGTSVDLLRQYVQQGGQLVVNAGGDFDPAKWNQSAWLDGNGILPARLVETPLGVTPEEDPQRVQAFELDFDSLKSHPYFEIEDNTEQHLRAIVGSALFFKAVDFEMSDAVRAETDRNLKKQFLDDAKFLQQIDQRQDDSGSEPKGLSDEDAQRLRQLRPSWLIWREQLGGTSSEDGEESAEARANRFVETTAPTVLARFTNSEKSAFLVERRIGDGRVLFFSTGLRSGSSTWNTVNGSPLLAVYDRILRSLVHSTLPQQNHESRERLTMALDEHDPRLAYALWRPGKDEPEMIDASFVGKKQRGFVVQRPFERGLYRICAYPQDAADLSTEQPKWQRVFSVNGASDESNLKALQGREFEERATGVNKVRWVDLNGEISLAGNQIENQDMWKWFVLAVLVFLLAELLLLMSPGFRRGGGPVETENEAT